MGKLLLGETDVSKLEDNIIIYFKPQDIKIWLFSNLRNRTTTFRWHYHHGGSVSEHAHFSSITTVHNDRIIQNV